ncbi:MAG: ABC transporter substrate-binding protein [Spirochaetales bacterium]|nr:ABC transporter substrate-binding protein [Spirochaetales bacterium]
MRIFAPQKPGFSGVPPLTRPLRAPSIPCAPRAFCNFGTSSNENRRAFCIRAALIFLILLTSLAGCGKPRTEQGGPAAGAAVAITDSFGRTLNLNEYPKRIVSLAPNMTETLFLLGAGDCIVGRTDYCDYPPEAAKIPSVGTITTPNIEHIISLRPDLIVGSTHFQKETLEALENLNIPVYLGIIYSDYEEIFDMIMTLGRIVDKTGVAENIVRGMRQRKKAVEEAVQNAAEKPRVYYMISYGDAGDYTAGRDTFISALIKSAGGLNAGDDIEGWRYSVEALFRDEPDIILCGALSGGAQALAKTPPYNRLKAVREGRVCEIDSNLLDRIGPRNIEGLEMLAKILHSGLDISP